MDKDNGILLSHQKGQIPTIYINMMELEGILLTEIDQSETDNHHMISVLRGI